MRRGRTRASDLKLRLAIRAAQIGIWEWDIDTGAMEYSARARAICGFRPEEPITIETVRAVTHPDDLVWTGPKAARALNPEVRDKTPYEYRIVRADNGETRWVLAYGEAIFERTGQGARAVRYLGTIQDITERKQAEAARLEGERRLRLAMEAAQLAVWEYDVSTEKISASPELNRLFDLPADAGPTTDQLRAMFAPGEWDRLRNAATEALSRGSAHFESELCIQPAGSTRWLLMRGEILSDKPGVYTRVVGVLLDIDERKRAEERLTLLLREVNHRVKNSLSVVQAIANQSFREGRADAEALSSFRGRLQALARANDALINKDFNAVSLRSLVEEILSPFGEGGAELLIAGNDRLLPPRLGTPLALLLHELATNAAKFGSLSSPLGSVEIRWVEEGGRLNFLWSERGGPPVRSARERGFGIRLMQDILPAELGAITLRFLPDGVECEASIALPEQ